MKKDSIWRKFEKSGSVFDYLEYACTCEEDVTSVANDTVARSGVVNCDTDTDIKVLAKNTGDSQSEV